MSLLEKYDNLKYRAIDIKSKKEVLQNLLSSHIQELTACQNELEEATHYKSILFESADILRQMIDIISREQINQLSELITYALKTIFTDRDYSIDIVVSESRSVKQANFILVENKPDGTVVRSDFKDSIGGGILSLVGLVIQCYYIIYYNQYPILFMDEALSQISSQYIPSVLEFINQLAKKRHFIFVLISHDERLIEYGDYVYSVNLGKVKKLK